MSGVLFQNGVEIGAAKSESADAGTARLLCGVHPGTRFRVDVERAFFKAAARVGLLDADCRRQNFMV